MIDARLKEILDYKRERITELKELDAIIGDAELSWFPESRLSLKEQQFYARKGIFIYMLDCEKVTEAYKTLD